MALIGIKLISWEKNCLKMLKEMLNAQHILFDIVIIKKMCKDSRICRKTIGKNSQ